MSVFLCSIHSPGISRLPSSFPFPGSTPENSRVHCLVLTPYQWSHGPEKRDLYDPIKPVPDPFRLSGTSQPRQKKKRPPYGVHSRVQLHSFEDLYGVGSRIYISIRFQQVYHHSLMQNDVASLGSSEPP